MRGRKPKPSAMKRLQGNPGKRTLNAKEPRPEAKIPKCPSHLIGAARAEWTRIVKILYRMRVITELDRATLAAYCTAYADYVKAEKQLKSQGIVIRSAGGSRYQNPWMGIKKRSMDQMVKFGAEFGLTPSSRARLRVEGLDEEEEKEKQLFPHAQKGTKK